jgi:hypothetical protein
MLIPRHITDAAKRIRVSAIVYGCEWHNTEATGPDWEVVKDMYCGPGAGTDNAEMEECEMEVYDEDENENEGEQGYVYWSEDDFFDISS